VPPIRVLLVDLPPLLREILGELLAAQPDLAVTAASGDGLRPPPGCTAPDVVVCGLEPESVPARLAEDYPAPDVIVVESDGGRAWLWRVERHRASLGELGPDSLLKAIRARRPA
jgi:chemotaxis response regulator CheB